MKERDLPAAERARVAELRRRLAGREGIAESRVRVVRSPYRACPLGAHVDHQMGEVTGMALDRALLLAFAARDDRRVLLESRQFSGAAEFRCDDVPRAPVGDWADYARGAALALGRRHELAAGIAGIVDGFEDVGGLSSSAAAGVAYLLALEAANGLELAPAENVELDRVIENEYIGLNNGILDQSTILLGRPDHLMYLDCRDGSSRLVPLGGREDVAVVVLFSGLRRQLRETDYNRRVAECREAARALLEAGGLPVPDPPVLRAVPGDVYERHAGRLDPPLRRRAAHFFGEQQRVRRGIELWRRGDLADFGRLVSESGRSSIENYECGNPYLISAYEALGDCPGVYGARFSGGGFRGCCVGLARPECRDEIARVALARYLDAHPDMAGEAEVYFCRAAEGASLLG